MDIGLIVLDEQIFDRVAAGNLNPLIACLSIWAEAWELDAYEADRLGDSVGVDLDRAVMKRFEFPVEVDLAKQLALSDYGPRKRRRRRPPRCSDANPDS